MNKEERESIIKDKSLTDKDKKTIIMSDFIGDYFQAQFNSPLIRAMIMGYYAFKQGYYKGDSNEVNQ